MPAALSLAPRGSDAERLRYVQVLHMPFWGSVHKYKTAAAAIDVGQKHYTKVKALRDGSGKYSWMYPPAHRSLTHHPHTPSAAAAAAAAAASKAKAFLQPF